ncbi:MAG: PIG-L family deacetylase [Balneolaceae bacterium]
MKIVYIFPHPDDESFGPAPAISAQLNQGHDVYLLTLTRGEATSQRHRLGINKKEMGEIRLSEMECVEQVLGLTGMTVLDLPDSELKNMDPIELEDVVENHIKQLKPDIVITYAVHGVSGFHDHLVCHAVVKRVFCKLRKEGASFLKRLALFTRMGEVDTKGKFRLEASAQEDIDCIVTCRDEDMRKFNRALDCYESYQEVIESSGVRNVVTEEVPFEFFQESYHPQARDITVDL